MSPETRAFLAAVRHAEDPSPGDESLVLAALHGALAAGTSVTATGASGAAKVALASSVSGLKLLSVLAVLAAGAAAGSVFVAGSPEHASRPTSPLASASAISLAAPRIVPSAASSAEEPLPTSAAPAGSSSTARAPLRAARAPSVREEIALLADVRGALGRGDGAAALARLDEHVTSDRQFVAERRAARILALCALGRTDEARRAAANFAQEHPGSVQRAALARSCAGDEIDVER